MSKVTLDDLRVKKPLINVGSETQRWVYSPATVEDLREVLESLPGVVRTTMFKGDRSYPVLVWRLPEEET